MIPPCTDTNLDHEQLGSRFRQDLRSNDAPEVELEVNGKSLGRKKPSEFPHAPHPLFLFHVDGFEAGGLLAKAWVGDKVVASDVVHTPERAERLLLQSDDKELIADGTDMTRIVIAAVDNRGTLVRKYDHRVLVEGANGTLIRENPIHLEGGRIAVYVQSRDSQVLPIEVRVSSPDLPPILFRLVCIFLCMNKSRSATSISKN